MRGAVAKKIRRAAERGTVGHPVVAYLRVAAGQIRIRPDTTRAAYRALKREFRGRR